MASTLNDFDTAASATATATPNLDRAPSLLLDGALPVLAHVVVFPIKWIFRSGLPGLFYLISSALRYIFTILYAVLRVVSAPIVYPLKLLFVWPALWSLNFLYQTRHLIYFVGGATLLGCLLGLGSSYILRGSISNASVAKRKRAETPDSDGGYPYAPPSEKLPQPSMRGALYDTSSKPVKRHQEFFEREPGPASARQAGLSDEDRFSRTMEALTAARRRRAGLDAK